MATCKICEHFRPGLRSKTTPAAFIESAESGCPGCSLGLQVLDSVTDIRRREFTELELERGGDYLEPGVLEVRCIQKGAVDPQKRNLFGQTTFVDPYPNRYKIFTSRGQFRYGLVLTER